MDNINMTKSLLALCIFLLTPALAQSQIPRLYIANDDHTDYIWTGTEEQYKDWFIEMLDYSIDQAERTKNDPPDFQGRFSADGNFWLWTYEKHKTRTEFEKLIGKIRSGHITVPLQTLVLLYGGMPAEAVLRSMYYAGRIERRHNLKFELACAMENQTLPLGLPSLWAGSGAKYSWRGVCGCSSKLNMYVDRPREIYHAQGADGRSVLMKWNSLFNNESVGGYAEARYPRSAVNTMSSNAEYLRLWPWSARGLFGKGWDDQKTLTDAFITTARDLSDSTHRVIVSNQIDFFKDFEQTAPGEAPVPTYSGSFGNEWDLYIASMAEVSANVKRSVEELRTAEALATIVSMHDSLFTSKYEAAADSAFTNMGLYYEHDWTMDGAASNERPAFQRRIVKQIQQYVRALKTDAAKKLAAYIPNTTGAKRFYVFNPLGWNRTDIVDIDFVPSHPVRVIDLRTSEEVRSQVIERDGGKYLRVLAKDVPSVGYNVYEIRDGQTQFADSAVIFTGYSYAETLEYRMRFNLGLIRNLFDKKNGNRDIVGTNGPYDKFMNRLEGAGGLGDGGLDIQSGPVSGIYEGQMGSNFGGAPHNVRLSMHKGIDRIDIENVMDYHPSDRITRDFNIDIQNYTVRHEEVGAIATARRVSEGGSYSDELARTDWLTMNHFVDISNDEFGVTISNWDSPFFKLGNSTVDSLDTATPVIRAVVAARFDGLGAHNQDGETQFTNRYAIQTHRKYDQAKAMRFALEHQNPLVGEFITGTEPKLPADSYSLLSVSDSNCILWALKPSEEGIVRGGIIAHVWNLADATASLEIHPTDRSITSAFTTTHIETNTGQATFDNASLKDRLGKQMMQTYRLYLSSPQTEVVRDYTPADIELRQNYPNPFSEGTTIQLYSPSQISTSHFSLQILDVLGRTVLDATDEARAKGKITVHRSQLPVSGVYFCKLTTPTGVQVRMMVAR